MSYEGCIKVSLLAGTAIATLGYASAFAQVAEKQKAESQKVEEVVVTATKMATRLQETPQTISIVSRRDMDIRGIQDLNAALSYSSGIRFRDYPGQQGMQEFFMRGFRVNNTAGSVFRDGLRLQFNGLDGDVEPYGLERIELLKGPASVLYGQAAPGGLVNAFTKRPTSSPMGEVLLQGGSYGRKQVAADVAGPIGSSDTFSYRLTGLYRESDTQFDFVPDNRRYVAPAFSWRPTDRTSLTFLSQYFRTETSGSDQSFPTSGTIYANPNGTIPSSRFLGEPAANRYEVEAYNAGYVFKQNLLEGLDFEQVMRFTNSDLSLIGVQVASSAALTGGRVMNRLALDRHAHSLSWMTDAHLAWTTNIGPVQSSFLAGYDYTWWRRTNVQRNGTVGTIDVFAPVYGKPITWAANLASNLRQSFTQTGAYGEGRFKYGGLSISGAVRQDWVAAPTTNRLNGARAPLNTDALTGRAGVIYEFNNGISPYASYSTSFQPLSGSTFAGIPFTPTTGEQFEGGVKYEPMQNLRITTAIYQLTQQNVTTPDQAHPGFFVQQGEVRSRGAEVELKTTIFDTDVSLAYTNTNAKTTKANPDPTTKISAVGLRQLAVAPNTISAWANREFAIGPGILNIGAGVRAISGSFNTDNSVKTSGYSVVDALVEYRLRDWSLSVNANNLLDKSYFTPGFYAQSVFFGYQRNILVTLKYHW